MQKPTNKPVGISVYFVALISITAFMAYATYWKSWLLEDTFWTFIYIAWPPFAVSYLGAMKPGMAALFGQFVTLVYQFLQKKITADELVQRLVILIKNAVTLINELQDIDPPSPADGG